MKIFFFYTLTFFFWGGVYVLLFSLLNRYIITKIDIFMEMHRILIQYVSTASDIWLKNRYLDSCFGLLLSGTCAMAEPLNKQNVLLIIII